MDEAVLPPAPVEGNTFPLQQYGATRFLPAVLFAALAAALLIAHHTLTPIRGWVGLGLTLLFAVLSLIAAVRPHPVSLSLTETALQVHWLDRTAEHPWEQVALAGSIHQGSLRLEDAAKPTGVRLDRLAYADRQRFDPLFLSTLDSHAAGDSEAAALLGGEPVTASKALLRAYGSATLGGALLLLAGVAMAIWTPPYRSNLPEMMLLWGAIFAGRGLYLWWQRTSRQVLFTDEGLVEYKLGSRMPVMRYEVIDHVLVSAEGKEPVLRVYSGKWEVAVYPQTGKLAGARRILRERATKAWWAVW